MTAANQLTILRIILAPVLLVLVIDGRLRLALAVFVAAGITDFLDGLVARLRDEKTALGAVLDPIADKVLMACAYVALTWGPELETRLPLWLTIVVLSRDVLLLTSAAIVNLTVGQRVFYPSMIGKISTVVHLVTIAAVLVANAIPAVLPGMTLLFWTCLLLTVGSALHYLYLAGIKGPGAAEDWR